MANIIRSTGFLASTLVLGACATDSASDKSEVVAPPDLLDIASPDHYVDALRRQHNVPGLALTIIDHGEVKTMRTYGNRKLEPATPLNADTVMYGASLTKFVFATYVMKLVDQGLLNLDESVSGYFPNRYRNMTSGRIWPVTRAGRS